MPKKFNVIGLVGLFALLLLASCSTTPDTKDWTLFSIEEEPAIDIEFRLPPDWYVDYMPAEDIPGKWEIVLVPPSCSNDQTEDYKENCVSAIVYIKGVAAFDKDATIKALSQSVSSYDANSTDAIPMSQDSFKVNGLTIQRYDRKITLGENEILISFYLFETDSANYIFVAEFPADELDSATAEDFGLMIQSIEPIK